jgi:hypothetical protein
MTKHAIALPYDAAIDLCGRLHIDVPYLPAADRHRDREEEPVSSDPHTTCTMTADPVVAASLTL